MKSLFLCLSVTLLWSIARCDNATQHGGVAAQLQLLINEEKDLRRSLESRVQRLKNEVAAVNTTIGIFLFIYQLLLHQNARFVKFLNFIYIS